MHFKFLHTADIHLDSPLRGLERYEGAPIDEIRGSIRQAFDHLIDLAIEEQVAFVLIAGDLYDGDWKDYNTALYFNKCMSKLNNHGIKVFLIRGNHDAASLMTKHLRLPENVTLFSTKKPQQIVLEDLNVCIHGQSYANRSVQENLSENYPEGDSEFFNIGMLHTSLDGREGHDHYAPCSVDDLQSKGYQYWALGHIHKREIVSKDPWIVFSGNIQGRHIGEQGSKGCTLVTVEHGEIATVKHHALDVMRWKLLEVDISNGHSLESVYELLREKLIEELNFNHGMLLAVRLIFIGISPIHSTFSENKEQLINELRATVTEISHEKIWLEKIVFRTKSPTPIEAIFERNDALSELLHSIDNVEFNEIEHTKLYRELDDLYKKLPKEIIERDDFLRLKHEPSDRNTIEEVKNLLVQRLLNIEIEK
ncbi:MAG: DNA repair exonuclease [Flavobacteriaceae bacterium]|nr:DNA repair exonuclease [Flavobacteriaceae bacterium]MCY4266807.1 DNA repair exonuclease [Flavobacteriaceae bacterium]